MANLSEQALYELGIYQIETTDPVVGGPDGLSNTQAKQLANRTAYLKQEVELRAPVDSPTFTGSPEAPTPAPGTDSTRLATTAFVQAAVETILNAPPATLDTLNELAAALGDDPNFATTVMTLLSQKAPLASPALTGVPTAPTASQGTDTTQLATTAFVATAIAGLAGAPNLRVFTVDATYVPLAGVTRVWMVAAGGGGAGNNDEGNGFANAGSSTTVTQTAGTGGLLLTAGGGDGGGGGALNVDHVNPGAPGGASGGDLNLPGMGAPGGHGEIGSLGGGTTTGSSGGAGGLVIKQVDLQGGEEFSVVVGAGGSYTGDYNGKDGFVAIVEFGS